MADEPATNQPVSQDMQAHIRDYSGFIKLFTYGAAVSLIIGLIVLFIIA